MIPGANVVLWGAGGHASVVADIIRESGAFRLVAYFDDTQWSGKPAFIGDVPVLSTREELPALLTAGTQAMVIAMGDCPLRMKHAGEALEIGFKLVTAVHPRATVATSVTLGAGTVVAAGAVINPGAVIGDNVIINTSAGVDHDCVIQSGAHIGPGVHLGGRVRVGEGAWVGIGAVVRDRINIGAGAMIGAGAVVVRDIPPRVVAYGVPARVIRPMA